MAEYWVTGKKDLANAIETAPLNEACTITLLHRKGLTTYRFPAMCYHDTDPEAAAHRERRRSTAKRVLRMAKELFE